MAAKYDYENQIELNWLYESKKYISDLNYYFKIIDIPEYVERPDSFYIKNNVPVEELYILLHKTPLERYKKYLLFAGWEFNQINIKETNNNILLENAKMLAELRKLPKKREKLKLIITFKEIHRAKTNDRILISVIENYLNDYLLSLYENNLDDKRIISDSLLNQIIKVETKKKTIKGAPIKKSDIAQFCELLIFLIYSDSDIKFNIEKFSNIDCQLIHDFLVLMNILKVNRNIITGKTSSPHSYIRILITNLRNQRRRKNIKLSYLLNKT